MNLTHAKLFFPASGGTPDIDFRCHDGTRPRSVVRRGAELAALPLPAPVTVKTYGELLAALSAAGALFAQADVEEEAREAVRQAARQRENLRREQEAEERRRNPNPVTT